MINEVTYITCHNPAIDIIIKDRGKKFGLKKYKK